MVMTLMNSSSQIILQESAQAALMTVSGAQVMLKLLIQAMQYGGVISMSGTNVMMVT